MNTLSKKLLPLILFAIAVTSLFSVQPAQAYEVTFDQVGSNVVATGSGAVDFTGFNNINFVNISAQINPSTGTILTGLQATPLSEDVLTGFTMTGPSSFGSGGLTNASFGSGFLVGINFALGEIFLPGGIGIDTQLPGSATWNNATFAGLGLTPGTYEWMWGNGANQNFTLVIGGAGVPDGGSTVSLLGCALLGLAALRRKLSC